MDSNGFLNWRNKAGVSGIIGAGGTVTSVAGTNANGFSFSISNPTTTPNITLSLSQPGVLWGFNTGSTNAIGATTIPNDTTKFLNGDTNPAYVKVKDSDLAVSNVTTNNVSASAHGFCPIVPNNTTTFLRGDGTFATPSTSGAVYTNGIASKNAADASTTQNIAHGLGTTPAKVRITAFGPLSSNVIYTAQAFTVYNGTTQSSFSSTGNTGAGGNATYQAFRLSLSNQGGGWNGNEGIITFNATNIVITWTLTGGGSGTYTLVWEANT